MLGTNFRAPYPFDRGVSAVAPAGGLLGLMQQVLQQQALQQAGGSWSGAGASAVACFYPFTAVRAARLAVELGLNQYKAGTINFLAVVLLQAAQLQNERTLVGLYGDRLTATVALVKALGGGWRSSDLPPDPHAKN